MEKGLSQNDFKDRCETAPFRSNAADVELLCQTAVSLHPLLPSISGSFRYFIAPDVFFQYGDVENFSLL